MNAPRHKPMGAAQDGAAPLARIPKAELVPDRPYRVTCPGGDILLAQVGARYHAIADACPHAGASLSLGQQHAHQLTCPRHGWVIDLRNGEVVLGNGEGTCTTTYRVVEQADMLWVYAQPQPASFKDHFSQQPDAYARYRPRYPAALFDALAERAPRWDLAWDCATGNGQAAHALAKEFDRVIASDASGAQIAQATPHPRITYRTEAAEHSSLADGSAALITVAQALHWLDLEAFYAEVRRVCQAGGVLAAWSYGLGRIELPAQADAVNRCLQRFYADTLGPYWPPERVHVDQGYARLPFPFERLALPALSLTHHWNLEQLCGYLATWSAYQRYRKARSEDPLPSLRAELEALWPDPEAAYPYRAPLSVLAGRVR